MSKNLIIVLIVILVAVIAGLLGWFFLKEEQVGTKTNKQAANNVEIMRPPKNTVWIVNGNFTPSVLTVKIGDKVTWINKDQYKRRVASDPHPTSTDLPTLVSNDLEKDESFTFSFTKSGEWKYHDYLNPVVHGTVVVK